MVHRRHLKLFCVPKGTFFRGANRFGGGTVLTMARDLRQKQTAKRFNVLILFYIMKCYLEYVVVSLLKHLDYKQIQLLSPNSGGAAGPGVQR